MNEQEQEGHSELDWLAFCYAAGELSGGEAESFEARLADDQAAREALARAVELSHAVAAVEAQSEHLLTPIVRKNNDWNTRLSWMAVGGLASLLLALLWSGVVGPTWKTAQRHFRAGAQHELALAWNMTRTDFADVREAGLWLPASAYETDDDLSADMRLDDLGVDESPSWLTAAVFGQSNGDSNQSAESFSRQR